MHLLDLVVEEFIERHDCEDDGWQLEDEAKMVVPRAEVRWFGRADLGRCVVLGNVMSFRARSNYLCRSPVGYGYTRHLNDNAGINSAGLDQLPTSSRLTYFSPPSNLNTLQSAACYDFPLPED